MTTTTVSTATHDNVHAAPTAPPRLWVAGLVSGAVAAAATTVTVLIARAAGRPSPSTASRSRWLGFAQMALLGAVLGGLIVAAQPLERAGPPALSGRSPRP